MTFHHDDSDEMSAPPVPFVVRAHESIDPRSGGRSLAKATAAATGGTLGLLKSELSAGPAAPLHVHEREDEAWIVESGELEYSFTTEPVGSDAEPGQTTSVRVNAGDVVFVPRGHAHSLHVLSETAQVWTLLTPGGLEDFLLDRDAGPQDPTRGVGDRPERFGITIYDDAPPPTP